MIPLAQRIAIAEACGWTHMHEIRLIGVPPEGHIEVIPDYLSDLNEIHEAEKFLTTNDEVNFYEETLKDLCGSYRCALHATAAQRGEAFLKTKGLWKD
jgi:hypothetical protein